MHPAESPVLGWPDVQPIQAAVLDRLQEAMVSEIDRFSPEALMNQWLSAFPEECAATGDGCHHVPGRIRTGQALTNRRSGRATSSWSPGSTGLRAQRATCWRSGSTLKEGGAGLRSLGEPWADTTSPAGKMVLTVFAGMAEFERALTTSEPVRGGLRLGREACASVGRRSLPRSRSPWVADLWTRAPRSGTSRR